MASSRPAVNRAVADEIAKSYEKFDRQELIQILSYLTKVYVVDGTMPFNLVPGAAGGKGGEIAAVEGAEKDFDFPKLIDQLKKRLPDLAELKYFQIEDGKVTLRVANQKVTFGERVTTEFVPTSQQMAPPAPSAAPPRGAPLPAGLPSSFKEKGVAPGKPGGAKSDAEKKGPALTEAQQEAVNDILTRFKNLEID